MKRIRKNGRLYREKMLFEHELYFSVSADSQSKFLKKQSRYIIGVPR